MYDSQVPQASPYTPAPRRTSEIIIFFVETVSLIPRSQGVSVVLCQAPLYRLEVLVRILLFLLLLEISYVLCLTVLASIRTCKSKASPTFQFP